jgi:hypothetical protein
MSHSNAWPGTASSIIKSREEEQKHANTRKIYQTINQFTKKKKETIKEVLAMNNTGRREIWKE